MKASHLINQFLYPLFPRRCEFCGEVILPTEEICEECKNSIEYVLEDINLNLNTSKFFEGAAAPFYYSSGVKKCILALKYSSQSENAKVLAKYMSDSVKYSFNDVSFDVIISVPLTSKKKRKRGFNQSELLAKRISKELNIPFEGKVLYRAFEKVEQKKLSREERLLNVENVFKLKNNEKINNKTVLLCDDVATTGATLNECAKMLIQGGANKVYCVTAAVAKGR